MKIWWIVSVPYALLFTGYLLANPDDAWAIMHAGWPLLVYYWLAYYSSIAWVLVGATRGIFNRKISAVETAMVIVGIVTITFPLAAKHRWPGF